MIINIRNCLLRSSMTNCTICYVNELGISVPAYDNYLQAIGIYKKLIADVFNVISILLLPAGQKATGKKSSSIYNISRGTGQLYYFYAAV